MIVLVIAGYAFLIIYEFVPLYKQKLWKVFLVNCVLCAMSITVAIFMSLAIKIPSPAKPIGDFITSIFGR